MAVTIHHTHDLEALVEHIHSLFNGWAHHTPASAINPEEKVPHKDPGPDGIYLMQLVVHEWLANLAQHADFEARTPEIRIRIHRSPQKVTYEIDDNSSGFDLEERLGRAPRISTVLPDRGMGLAMMQVCSEEIHYRRLGRHRNRLVFSVALDGDPFLEIPFR